MAKKLDFAKARQYEPEKPQKGKKKKESPQPNRKSERKSPEAK